MRKRIDELSLEYNNLCNEYVHLFQIKQDYEFCGWIGGVGGIADFIGEYFFNIDDIMYDMNNKCKKGLIFEWQNYNLDNESRINYSSYCKGARR